MPLSIGLLIFIVGLWFLYSQNYKKAKLYLTISFLWIFIVSYSPFANNIITPVESTYKKIDKNVTAKYILLLGGDYEGRAYEAIRLYKSIPNSKIITSGYEGREKIPEAIINKNKLISFGIPEEDILMQVEPKDTQQEAVYVKKIVGTQKFILVTSAYHMPRAMELFKKEGLNPIPAPTNFLKKEKELLSAPSGSNLVKTEIVFHEYLGMTWNKIKSIKQKVLDILSD